MKILLCLFSIVISANGQCFDLKPKTKISFRCSDDNKSLIVNDGTSDQIIQSDMIIWKQGMPTPGCTQKIVRDITAKGFYCDGHYLSDYKNNEVEFSDIDSCQKELNAKQEISWN